MPKNHFSIAFQEESLKHRVWWRHYCVVTRFWQIFVSSVIGSLGSLNLDSRCNSWRISTGTFHVDFMFSGDSKIFDRSSFGWAIFGELIQLLNRNQLSSSLSVGNVTITLPCDFENSPCLQLQMRYSHQI